MRLRVAKSATVKGHWPKGKRRNHPRGWITLVKRLDHYIQERASAKAAARAIGVSDRTIHRWLAGEDVGTEESAAQIRELLRREKW
jgi:LmbE family N-acetylglucosaminyl deacetylase